MFLHAQSKCQTLKIVETNIKDTIYLRHILCAFQSAGKKLVQSGPETIQQTLSPSFRNRSQTKFTHPIQKTLPLLLISILFHNTAQADLFHYSNLLIGPRAIGFGGAFTALSDDTSGLFYNPGGLALQSALELNGSINTFYLKKSHFENVFGDKEFTESARGSLSSFFGLSKRIYLPLLGHLQVGLAFINPDASLSDENILIENEPDPNVIRYHRSANIRTGSSQVLLGAAKRFGKYSGIGCAASYLDVDELEQIYQDVIQGPYTAEELPGKAIYSTLGQNIRAHLVVRGGGLRCGFRTGFDNGLRFGISYHRSDVAYQNFEYDFEINKVFTDKDNSVIKVDESNNPQLKGNLQRTVTRIQNSHFVSTWPDELRVGVAYQFNPALTFSSDLVRHGEGNGTTPRVKRAQIYNIAAGAELILAQLVYLRGGYFTNNDATASRNLNSADQRKEYMDYRGVSISAGLKLKTGDYGLHYTEQRGRGLAEKVTGKQNRSTGQLQVISISASQSFQ
jgi:long-chain fatty acid transport protein